MTMPDRLLDAAERVVRRDGVAALTLDAVSREAHVSKGGLLYHYRSKEALVRAMVARLVASFERARERALTDAPAGAGRWTQAYVQATIAPDRPSDEVARETDVASSLVAALGADPDLLIPVRAHYAVWQARLESDGLDPAHATLARLAADGLWFADLFGLAPPHGPLRERVREALVALIGGASTAGEAPGEAD